MGSRFKLIWVLALGWCAMMGLWSQRLAAKVLEAATSQAGVAAADNKVEKKVQAQSQWQVCQVGDILLSGDRIRTGPDSGATLMLADKSLLRLSQNAEVAIVELHSGDEDSLIRRFQLASGRLWSDVTPADSKSSVFEVQGPNAVASVKGTSFEVGADDPSGETEINVWEGAVECSNPDLGEAPQLIGAEQSFNQFRAGRQGPGRRLRFDTSKPGSWQQWNLGRRLAWKQAHGKFPRRLDLNPTMLRNFQRMYHQAPPSVQRKIQHQIQQQHQQHHQGNPGGSHKPR